MKVTRRSLLQAAGTATALSGFTVRAQAGSARPNIVMLISDDQSQPDLGSYGNDKIRTPHLDRLATEGLRFTRAYVISPQCSPNRAGLLTGRSPHSVGAARLHAPVRPEYLNIVRLLKQAGYYTGAYRKTHQPLIEKEFDYYGDDQAPLETFFTGRPLEKPFFLWFGSRHPHRPYQPGTFSPPTNPEQVIVPDYLPDTPEVRKDLADYYDAIARFDSDCGFILAQLEAQEVTGDTLVIMTSDNGMPFPRAKGTLYEAGIATPLIVRWPGQVSPGISENLVTALDLPATVLAAAGVTIPPNFEGTPSFPVPGGTLLHQHKFVFAERNWHDNFDPMRAVVSQDYKLILNFRPEVGYLPTLDVLESPSGQAIIKLAKSGSLAGKLAWYQQKSRPRLEFYHLPSDPGEWQNRAEDPALKEALEEHLQALSQWMLASNDFLPPPRGSFPGYPQYDAIDALNGGVMESWIY